MESVRNESREYLESYISHYYSDTQHKWVPVEIDISRKIAEGNFMSVFEAEAKLPDREKQHFIIKRPLHEFFQEPKWDDEGGYMRNGEEGAIGICSNETRGYRVAKKKGLKVFPLCDYIYGQKGPEIIETSGFDENWVCVGDKGEASKVETFGREKISKIDNFDSFLDVYLRQSELGYLNGMFIGADAYLFLVHRRLDELDFVVGDVNTLESERYFVRSKDVWNFNFDHAVMGLKQFLDKNTLPPKTQEYLERCKKRIEEIKDRNKTKVEIQDVLRKLRPS